MAKTFTVKAHMVKAYTKTLGGGRSKRYDGMDIADLVKIKKKKYANVDITTPLSRDEKILQKSINKKFSAMNDANIARRRARRILEGKDPNG